MNPPAPLPPVGKYCTKAKRGMCCYHALLRCAVQIREVVLVEVAGGLVKHERLTKAVAASISENMAVTVLHVTR